MKISTVKKRFRFFGRRIYKNSVLYIINFWIYFFRIENDEVTDYLYDFKSKIVRIWTTQSLTKKEQENLKLLIEAWQVEMGL